MIAIKILRRHDIGPLQLSALLTWALLSIVLLLALQQQTAGAVAWGVTVSALLGYFVATLGASWGRETGPAERIRWACLAAMVLAIAVVSWHVNQTIQMILLIVFAGILPFYCRFVRSLLLLLMAHSALTLLLWFRWHPDHLTITSGLYLAFELFALFSSRTAANERQACEALAETNRQLEATQALLTDAAKLDERLRIARDLHDVMGHHLTGLSLQLEVARHQIEGKGREHVEQAQALTKLLLADVRQVVADNRDSIGLDIRESLRTLASAARARIILDMPDPCEISDARIAEALFRTAQEIITNSNKHSRSSLLKLSLREDEGYWRLSTEEACRPNLHIDPGHGLTGMRERLSAVGGKLTIETRPMLTHRVAVPKHD